MDLKKLDAPGMFRFNWRLDYPNLKKSQVSFTGNGKSLLTIYEPL
jgi:hypothetical protein